MRNRLNKIIKVLPYVLLILICAFLFMPKVSQNDLYFDLKSAKDLLKYGLDFKDHFSFITNLNYLYHHYLYDLIIYFVFKIKGFSSVFYFFLLLYSLFGILIFKVTKKYTNNNVLAFLSSFITILFMKNFFSTRVQSISYIIFYLEIYFLNKLYDTGLKRYSFLLILGSVILVNIHMTVWIIYLVLFLPYFEEIFLGLLSKEKKEIKYISNKIVGIAPKSTKTYLMTFLITIFTGLLSPFKLLPYTFFIKTLGNKSYDIVIEMQKTVLISNGKLLILMIAMFMVLILTNTKVRIKDIFLILGLGILSLIANRHMAYFLLIIPTIIFTIIGDYIKINKFNCKQLNLKKLPYILIIILIVVYSGLIVNFSRKSFDYGEKKEYPTKIVNYIKNNIDYKNMRMYNEFNYGAYLAYNDIPVFVDSRVEVYLKTFNNNKDILDDYIKCEDYVSYKLVFDIYQINYALVIKDSPIYTYLVRDNDFSIVKEENKYVLFKKY